jgi:Fe2+ transport system protein FeoA
MELHLTDLKNGETGVITSTDVSSESQQMRKQRAKKGYGKHLMSSRFVKRLTDLGLTPGTNVTVVKSAPFHGPLEVCFRGSRLAIGRRMASRILVDVKR